MGIKSKGVLVAIIVFSLAFFVSLCMLNVEKNKEKALFSVVEATYEQAMKGENIPCEKTWEIAKLYHDGVRNLSESEWDELDRKINVIADSCEFDSSNPASLTPFSPAAKELRHDKPAGS